MSHNENPSDLSPLEQRLQNRHMNEPSIALQSRIMQAVTKELRSSSAPTHRGASFLSFAAAMAAALLIGLNLSLTTTAATSFDSRPRVTLQQTLDDAATIQQLSPDLSKAEAMRMSLLMHAGDDLREFPDVHSSAAIESGQMDGTHDEGNLR